MTKEARLGDIDLLRFVAALAVVFFHYSFRGYTADAMSIMPYPLLAPIACYGYLGVELFFMISGFVILMTAKGATLRRFVVSRAARLFPALWACCTLTYLTTISFGAPRYTATFGQYLANMGLIANILGQPSMDGAYWSLYWELGFYAWVAVVVALGLVERAEWLLTLWLGSVAFIEVAHIPRFHVLLLVDYAAFFIGGAVCYLVWEQGLSLRRWLMLLASWALGNMQSLGRLHTMEMHHHVRLSHTAVTFAVTSFFGVMLLVALRRTGALGRMRWAEPGALTYPLYLLHQYIGFMIFNRLYPTVNAHLLLWGTLATMLGLSYGVHLVIERPLSRWIKASFAP